MRNFHEGMVCECFRNCYSLNYMADARPSFLSPETRGNRSYVDLDIHFRFETMLVYRTSLVFGWVDLMGELVVWIALCSLVNCKAMVFCWFQSLLVALLDCFSAAHLLAPWSWLTSCSSICPPLYCKNIEIIRVK